MKSNTPPTNGSAHRSSSRIDRRLLAENLTIQRGDVQLCQDINFHLDAGDILHITGHNGVGKSTLMYMLAGLLPVIHGTLSWYNLPPKVWSTLWISHKNALNHQLSVLENFKHLIRLSSAHPLHGAKHAVDNTKNEYDLQASLSWADLAQDHHTPAGFLSAGQQQRIQLARLHADLHCPTTQNDAFVKRLWLLDEPFTAVDHRMQHSIVELMGLFTQQGGRIILTSHQPVHIACHTLSLSSADVTLHQRSPHVV